MNETRDRLQDLLIEAPEARESPWEKFGYLGNPFPGAGQVWPQVCHDQEDIKKAIEGALNAFVNSNYESSRLLVIGDHGTGKTNILKHYEYHLKGLRQDGIGEYILPVYVTGDVAKFVDLYSRTMDAIDRGLLVGLADAMQSNDKYGLLKTQDLRAALRYLGPDTPSGDSPEARQTLFFKWIRATDCYSGEYKRLGVSGSIGTASRATTVLADLIRSAGEVSLFSGMVLFLDEFEEAFMAGLSEKVQARYLQDLRNLIDIVQTGIMLVVAGTPIVEKRLQTYRALQRRLGPPHHLADIQNADDAVGYAWAYKNHARDLFKRVREEPAKDIPDLLPDKEVQRIFEEIESRTPVGLRLGMFIEELHEEARRVVEEEPE